VQDSSANDTQECLRNPRKVWKKPSQNTWYGTQMRAGCPLLYSFPCGFPAPFWKMSERNSDVSQRKKQMAGLPFDYCKALIIIDLFNQERPCFPWGLWCCNFNPRFLLRCPCLWQIVFPWSPCCPFLLPVSFSFLFFAHLRELSETWHCSKRPGSASSCSNLAASFQDLCESSLSWNTLLSRWAVIGLINIWKA